MEEMDLMTYVIDNRNSRKWTTIVGVFAGRKWLRFRFALKICRLKIRRIKLPKSCPTAEEILESLEWIAEK